MLASIGTSFALAVRISNTSLYAILFDSHIHRHNEYLHTEWRLYSAYPGWMTPPAISIKTHGSQPFNNMSKELATNAPALVCRHHSQDKNLAGLPIAVTEADEIRSGSASCSLEIGFSLVRARTEKSLSTSDGSVSRNVSSTSPPIAHAHSRSFLGKFRDLPSPFTDQSTARRE